MSRDLTGHFFCRNCCRLHPSSLVGPPGPAFQPSKRLRCLDKEAWTRPSYDLYTFLFESAYRLSFAHVHLALKRHYHGPKHGISTLAFTRVSRRNFEKGDGKRVTNLMSVEARISPNPAPTLCLRFQRWVVINTTDQLKLFRCAEDMLLCHHLLSALLDFLLESKMKNLHSESPGYQGVPGVFNCNSCNAVTQLEVKRFSREESAMLVTRWIDLGSGITPPAVRWIFERTAFWSARLLISSNTGDARSRFESQSGSSLDRLSQRNASLLTGGRYRKEMDPWSSVWILQGERRLPFLSYVMGWIDYLL